jgi:hypothetical protein
MTKLSSKLAASARAAASPETPALAPLQESRPTSRRPQKMPADASRKEPQAPRFPAPRRVWPD